VIDRPRAIAANNAQLTSSAATVPPAATTRPPMTGPAMNAPEKPKFAMALPSRRRSSGLRICVRAAAASDRAVAAMTPSASASTSTGISVK
jgi:hypothetical protein